MLDLEEITGANEQDNILVQHFAIEKKYEENLSKTNQNKSGLIYWYSLFAFQALLIKILRMDIV